MLSVAIKRSWLITGAILGLAGGAYLAYSEYMRHTHLPTPSMQADDPFSSQFARTLAKYRGVPGDCEFFVWTNELPKEIDFELSGLELSGIYICRPEQTFLDAEHKWLIRISGRYENVPDEVLVKLGDRHEYKLTSCPTFPLLGRWGLDTIGDERSNVWWKIELVVPIRVRKVPQHQIRTESREFSGFPLELPPGKEAYFIRPPIEGRKGIFITGTFGKPD